MKSSIISWARAEISQGKSEYSEVKKSIMEESPQYSFISPFSLSASEHVGQESYIIFSFTFYLRLFRNISVDKLFSCDFTLAPNQKNGTCFQRRNCQVITAANFTLICETFRRMSFNLYLTNDLVQMIHCSLFLNLLFCKMSSI